MSTQKRVNFVTFTQDAAADPDGGPGGEAEPGPPVYLLLEEPLRWRPGVKPSLVRAIVPFTEFDKLAFRDDGPPEGTLRLWFENDPQASPTLAGGEGGEEASRPDADVTLAKWTIVDVEADEFGQTPQGDAPRVVTYRLFLADWRHAFAEPRGGRLDLGILNPKKKKKAAVPGAGPEGVTSASADDAEEPTGPDKKWKNSELIKLCLDVMAVAGESATISIPEAVDAVAAPTDIEWRGAHAPTELDKLLEHCHAEFIPLRDGTARIEMIGLGTPPTLPEAAQPVELVLPGLDRRAKKVVVAGYPTQAVNVLTTDDLPERAFEPVFMYSATDDTFEAIDFCEAFRPDATAHVRTGYRTVPPQWRELARLHAYTLLRLDPELFDPRVQPILRRCFESRAVGDTHEVMETEIRVEAKVAVRDAETGMWKNSDEFVRIPVVSMNPNVGVLKLGARLGKLAVSPSADPDADFTPLEWSDLRIRFAVGDLATGVAANAAAAASGTDRPLYFAAVFKLGAGGAEDDDGSPELVSDGQDEVAAALKEADTSLVTDPGLMLVTIAGDPVNRDKLIARAKQLALPHLRSARPVKTRVAFGFHQVELSGRVSEIAWDQRATTTTLKQDGYHAPTGSRGNAGGGRRGGFRTEAAEHPDRSASGTAGATQPTVSIDPVAGGAAVAPRVTAKVTGSTRDGPRWRWTYTLMPVMKGTAGFDGWASVPDAVALKGYNRVEAVNGSTGTLGNGVLLSSLSGTGITAQPVPNGVVLEATVVRTPDGQSEAWFSYETGLSGGCS